MFYAVKTFYTVIMLCCFTPICDVMFTYMWIIIIFEGIVIALRSLYKLFKQKQQ